MAVTRDNLLAAGVRNLKEFGYPSVTKDNILTTRVFRSFFKSMLEDNKGQGADAVIDALLAEIKEKNDGEETR